jgi:putative hydrolase
MGTPPFGFSPFGAGSGDGDDLSNQMPLFAELQKLLSWQGGPVNWDLAKQLAVSTLGGTNQPVGPAENAAIEAAVRLADLWLDEATDLPSGVTHAEGWTRLEWLTKTLPVWSALCDPVASRVVEAMGKALPTEQLGGAGGAEGNPLAAFGLGAPGGANPFGAIMNQVGGLMFGAQVGQGLGELAKEVVASTDIGLPLGPVGVAALVPENVESFGEGLERPSDEVRLYLALREAAHQRLYSHVPWLRQRLIDTVEAFGRGITVDTAAIEQAMGSIDPTRPESVQDALTGGLFEPQTTEEQKVALRRLETLLALIEGWVDTVVTAAAGERMPGAAALREAVRRRRATGGPAEQTFATLVGLELRPRRLREAATLWWAVGEKHGAARRDAIWEHPDLLPTADDLEDPIGFAENLDKNEIDTEGLEDL